MTAEKQTGSARRHTDLALTAKITSKGQITLPKFIREHLNLVKGDLVEFLIGSNGMVAMMPASADVRKLKGLVPKPESAVYRRACCSNGVSFIVIAGSSRSPRPPCIRI